MGKVIHDKGVVPDIIAEEVKKEAIEPPEEKITKPQEIFEEIEKKEKAEKVEKPFDYKSDNQLMRAVDVLKALKLYKDIKSQ